jgi:hypothetical protein
MAKMGKYCKAYPITKLRKFNGWSENAEERQAGGNEASPIRLLADEDFLYLQETFVVTDGIFLDENIIFDNVTPEWVEFCKHELHFKPVTYEPDMKAES